MRFAQFQSRNPIDHVSRALGQLDRMGFALDSISVRQSQAGLSEVKIVFDPAGKLSAQVLADRIAQLRGILAFQHGQVS
ncbi:hypothetical protein [Mesorhizobium sp. 2RAF21]|uniref:hypothetical protein n=1 Tax=Mesorhizobium sp. 2RAF21 TaxID=3232995 RepID=UPI003F9919C0